MFVVVGIFDIQIVVDIFLFMVECFVLFDVMVGVKIYIVVVGQMIELDVFFIGNIIVVVWFNGIVYVFLLLKKDLQIFMGKIRMVGIYIGLFWFMGDMVNL